MGALSERTRAERWREILGLVIRGYGVTDLRPKQEFDTLSEFFKIAADAPEGRLQSSDLVTRRWAINTSNRQGLSKASVDLAEVAKTAAFDGRALHAVISRRLGYKASQSYVLMTLESFSKILKEDEQ